MRDQVLVSWGGKEIAPRCTCDSESGTRFPLFADKYILFDCPGQIELFTHHHCMRSMTDRIVHDWDIRVSVGRCFGCLMMHCMSLHSMGAVTSEIVLFGHKRVSVKYSLVRMELFMCLQCMRDTTDKVVDEENRRVTVKRFVDD